MRGRAEQQILDQQQIAKESEAIEAPWDYSSRRRSNKWYTIKRSKLRGVGWQLHIGIISSLARGYEHHRAWFLLSFVAFIIHSCESFIQWDDRNRHVAIMATTTHSESTHIHGPSLCSTCESFASTTHPMLENLSCSHNSTCHSLILWINFSCRNGARVESHAAHVPVRVRFLWESSHGRSMLSML